MLSCDNFRGEYPMRRSLLTRFAMVMMVGFICLPLYFALLSRGVQAQPYIFHPAMPLHRAIANTNNSTSVTVLDLDMSGSMTGNDPSGLRCAAANAYIDLSGPGNFIGVIGLDSAG